MEAEAINVYERGDWKIKLRARSVCKSTTTHFLCTETFEAWEGDRAVFSRAWDKTNPEPIPALPVRKPSKILGDTRMHVRGNFGTLAVSPNVLSVPPR